MLVSLRLNGVLFFLVARIVWFRCIEYVRNFAFISACSSSVIGVTICSAERRRAGMLCIGWIPDIVVDRLNTRFDGVIDRMAMLVLENETVVEIREHIRHVARETVHRNKTRQLHRQVYHS